MVRLTREEVERLFRVRRTVLEMLKDRGYAVSDSELMMEVNDYDDKFGRRDMNFQELYLIKSKPSDPSDQIYVFFHEEPKVGVITLKTYVHRMKSENAFRAILVVQKSLTRFAQTALRELAAKFQLEVFQERELQINIKNHELVPTHQVLTNEEKMTLLERYTLQESQLPRIPVNDSITRYYGLKQGRITRTSETAGRYITYRYVV